MRHIQLSAAWKPSACVFKLPPHDSDRDSRPSLDGPLAARELETMFHSSEPVYGTASQSRHAGRDYWARFRPVLEALSLGTRSERDSVNPLSWSCGMNSFHEPAVVVDVSDPYYRGTLPLRRRIAAQRSNATQIRTLTQLSKDPVWLLT